MGGLGRVIVESWYSDFDRNGSSRDSSSVSNCDMVTWSGKEGDGRTDYRRMKIFQAPSYGGRRATIPIVPTTRSMIL
jgi:hypothetical protein